jgi:transcriptional regulator with XRE-family HTH domain
MGFYENYLYLCQKNGLKPHSAKIMKIAGVSPSTVAGWKNGAEPSAKPLLNLSKFFGVSVEELLSGAKENTQHAEINNSQKGDNATITNRIGDSDTDITTNNYYGTIHHIVPKKEVEVTKDSKRYFFSLLDNIRDMDDSQLLEMLKYSKYLLSKD